jgi:chemotaxis protein CheD
MHWDPRWQAYTVKIGPGDYYVAAVRAGERPPLITTVLGSCVSVCICDPKAGLGGMNHFMLPDEQPGNDPLSRSARYGAFAMEQLINELLHFGASRDRLEVKVTGGGDMTGGHWQIGEQNARFVHRYLLSEGFRVLSEDLGGACSRRVVYDPAVGRMLVKKSEAQWRTELLEQERRYRDTIVSEPDGGDVELF